ncbi:histidine--tRNA ligase [Leadbettera azotonutricia]|uniref:Histidine--tRNA ligase n=1 Tax=Leadbettera azotonutricia (strain ATCC BAA-888 / DSM 13862 / ZAS-9) TaxID=545695 RepID=F5YCA3_LEAAZ|nr:histidine--tRNA ligase [Leadbettera azotonutricia]AEF82096.1 histidine--tRNA ligase [Leadbettera azotonutricia ZAS-9]
MAAFIEPRILKGFRDFLPPAEIARRDLLEKIEASFRSFGFVPIDTPALEYTEILLGKGGGETEKQVYRFKDNGDRDVALRFDLTVPFARFVAEHRQEIALPFKRYHIAKVWRGENTQRGRYREFTQCDFDIVGSDSAAADFEILLMMKNALGVLGAGEVSIRLNHRGLFNRFLSRIGVLDKSVDILRAVDKLEKIGRDETLKLLSESTGTAKAEEVLKFIEIKGSFDEILNAMKEAASGNEACPEAERLMLIRRFMIDSGIAENFVLDPSITRGLDYYTGIVYETLLKEMPELGSVCSGGRYDNLAALYSKEAIPGVGSSIGIDRLIAGLEHLGKLQARPSYASAAIACIKEDKGGLNQALAEKFRQAGIPCEVFLDEAKLTKQFMLAEKKGLRWLIIPGEDPLKSPLILRDLPSRENKEGLSVEEAVKAMSALHHETQES